jgi:hypothetical protein
MTGERYRDIMNLVPDILIRDLPDHVIASIDANARRLGLSRNEYLRRQLAGEANAEARRGKVTAEDLKRLSSLVSDIIDPEVMAGAWD